MTKSSFLQWQFYRVHTLCKNLAGGCMESESEPLLHVDALRETTRDLEILVSVGC